MNIAISFRHMDATEAVKGYVSEKIGKLQKFLRQPMIGQVTLSCQNHRFHHVEASIQSGGEHFHAHETAEDMYAAIDKVSDKLERQVRHIKETSRQKGADRASDHLADALLSEE